ncbi:hypothetical protein Peur_034948 [Populus x canadensis]
MEEYMKLLAPKVKLSVLGNNIVIRGGGGGGGLRDCKRRESKKWWEPNNCKTLRMEPQPPRKSNGRYTTLASSISLLSHHQRVPLSSLARKTMLMASGSLLLQWPLYSSSLTKMLVEWSSLSLLKEKSMWVFDVFAYCFFILVPNVSSC